MSRDVSDNVTKNRILSRFLRKFLKYFSICVFFSLTGDPDKREFFKNLDSRSSPERQRKEISQIPRNFYNKHMNMQFIVIGAVLFLLIIIAWWLGRSKKLPAQIITKYSAKISATKTLDPAHAIMESHKIFVEALSYLYRNKKMTAAQKIAGIQKRLPNAQKIWTHHRLRNRIAHETDVRASKLQAENARKDFIRALEKLG